MSEKEQGEKAAALSQSLTGSDSGSDTRAGSLRGGAATGSDDDEDAAEINKAMAEEGQKLGTPKTPTGG